MTGKAYYITTLADWQRHAPRFANSHFIVLDPPAAPPAVRHSERSDRTDSLCPGGDGTSGRAVEESLFNSALAREPAAKRDPSTPSRAPADAGGNKAARDSAQDDATADGATRILVLIEADEGVHLSLEDDAAFEPLAHPLAQKPISESAQAALAPHGVAPGSTTFEAAEILARFHPLLKHRVF